MSGNLFLYQPGGTPGVNVFNDWQLLMDAMVQVGGRKILEFDDSIKPCKIPPGLGKWPMKDVMWAGFGPRRGVPRTTVEILSGAQFKDLRMIGGQITIVNSAMEPAPSPVSDFVDGVNHVQIGMRDDCGNTQFVNPGDVPMFDLGGNSAIFFVQNCLFGMPIPGNVPNNPGLPVTSLPPEVLAREEVGGIRVPDNNPVFESPNPGILSKPLIRQSAGSTLTLNLLGQNQTGPNLVSIAPGTPGAPVATVLFAALSSAAQVAYDQTSISGNGGTIQFGPQGRIQRNVLRTKAPIPINKINKPNVLILCDCSAGGFTQGLPAIASGFTIANTQIPLYSGGQEVVIAEVAGGTGLQVSPGTNTTTNKNDTIDGHPGPVTIGPHGSRTLISDGASNWITISRVVEQ